MYGLCDGISNGFSVIDYISYDAATGETSLTTFDIRELQLDINDTAYSQGTNLNVTTTVLGQDVAIPMEVIGDEGRTSVSNVNATPYRSIACILVRFPNTNVVGIGTGFMIGPRHMLTSAHCVNDSEYGIATSITAFFGATGAIYETAVDASSWVYCSAYPSNRVASNDWACIEFSSEPNRGFFSIGYASNSTLLSKDLTVCGYPSDKMTPHSNAPINGDKVYMYKMSEKPTGFESGIIEYTIDTFVGQSGSPVYCNSNIVYGIHSRFNEEGNYNMACRITAELFNMFESSGWIEE